jgi:hypothetical protein
MGWKMTLALMLLSGVVISVSAARGKPENEVTLREEAVQHLRVLREHLLGR